MRRGTACTIAALFGILILVGVSQRDRLRALQVQILVPGPNVQRDIMIPMADGIRLATDVYWPDARPDGLPALLLRLPYGKDGFEGALWWARAYTPRGYAVVIQDLRGRHDSEGVFAPYAQGAEDGATTMNWIAAQPWSNGAIATAGCSALGEIQVMQAATGNPHLRALIAEGAGGAIGTGGASRGYFGLFEGGIPNLSAAYGWFSAAGGKTPDQMQPGTADPADVINQLPSGTLVSRHRTDPTDYEDFMARFEDPAYWASLGYLTAEDRFAVPALHVNTWHDIAVRGTFETASLMRANATVDAARDHQHVLIGPGLHCALDAPFIHGRVGDLPVTRGAGLDFDAIYAQWLDHWLRDGPAPTLAQYTYFVMGADRWDMSEAWPPAGTTPQRWHLGWERTGTLGTATVSPGAASYRYDPINPTPSIGGPICCTGGLDLTAGPLDQSANATRTDVLAFASVPLQEPITIVGDATADVSLSVDVPDTDLVAVLVDIHPDGRMLTITQGALRLRYRGGFDAPEDIMPGAVVQAHVAFAPIAYQVAPGHRIGLHLSSASFPRLERNLNTGALNHLATETQVATITVHFGGATGSALVLPVQPDPHSPASRAD